MNWKTFARVSAVILLLIALTNFYFAYFGKEGPHVEFRNIPSSTELDSLDVKRPINFSFFLYNSGDEAAFVKEINGKIQPDDVLPAGTLTISPSGDLSILPKDSQEITVQILSPGQKFQGNLTIMVFYESTILLSDQIPVSFGAIL